MRIVFMGTPDFAVPTLAEIVGAGHEVLAVYTQPPRPAGRGMAERKSPVHVFAEMAGLSVRTPASFKGAPEQQAFADLGADAVVVVAYGLLLPTAVLEAPRLGCYNLHASALPRWRGAAPIQRAIMAGDRETAAMVMRMQKGLDTGPICLAEAVAIGPDTTAGELHDQIAERGAGLMVRALGALERGTLDCVAQTSDGASYATTLGKDEGRIDFGKPARAVHDLVRGLSPFPGAWFEAGPEGKRERIKVLRTALAGGAGLPGVVLDDNLAVACGEGAVRLLELQRAGKKPMRADELLRGFPLARGAQL
jgi:methionyl-tRNA formyltransferase